MLIIVITMNIITPRTPSLDECYHSNNTLT
jgi:hypothetical protein